MKILLAVILSLSLVGCVKEKIIYRTVEVEVPVYQIPKYEIPDKPILPVDELNIQDSGDHNKIGNSYVLSIDILKSYATELLNILEGIKEEPSLAP